MGGELVRVYEVDEVAPQADLQHETGTHTQAVECCETALSPSAHTPKTPLNGKESKKDSVGKQDSRTSNVPSGSTDNAVEPAEERNHAVQNKPVDHREDQEAKEGTAEHERGACRGHSAKPGSSAEPKEALEPVGKDTELPCSRQVGKKSIHEDSERQSPVLSPLPQGDLSKGDMPDCALRSLPSDKAATNSDNIERNVAKQGQPSTFAPSTATLPDENGGSVSFIKSGAPSLKLPVASITDRAKKQLLSCTTCATVAGEAEDEIAGNVQKPAQEPQEDRLNSTGALSNPDIPNIFSNGDFLASSAQESSEYNSMESCGTFPTGEISNGSEGPFTCTLEKNDQNSDRATSHFGKVEERAVTAHLSSLRSASDIACDLEGTARENIPECMGPQDNCTSHTICEFVEHSSLSGEQQIVAGKEGADDAENEWEVDLEPLPERLVQVPSPNVASMDLKENFESDACRSEDLSVEQFPALQTVSEGSDSMLGGLERNQEQDMPDDSWNIVKKAQDATSSASAEMSRLMAFEQEAELLAKLQMLLDIRINNPQLRPGASTRNVSENVLDLLHLRATGQAVQWKNGDIPLKKACILPGGDELQKNKSSFSAVPRKSKPKCAASLGSCLMGWRQSSRRLTTACTLTRRRMAQILPISYSYTHSSARGVEREQKLLDVRFRPEAGGGPPTQLVVSANKSPSELVMYNLVDGTRKDLAVPNGSAIQDVIYARKGHLIVSAGALNGMVHVWDSFIGELLHTFGPRCDVLGTPGHQKEVGQLALLEDNSMSGRCLLATHGCSAADRHILLWDLEHGRHVHSVNGGDASRQLNALAAIGMDVVVGLGGQMNRATARAEVWDTQSSAMKFSVEMPGRNIDVVHGSTIGGRSLFLTGCETGTTHIFDMRDNTGNWIFSTEPSKTEAEATSASFSYCGRFMQTSSSSNLTLVYDLRNFKEPLHRLDHGKPAKTIEPEVDPGVVSVRAYTVDKGDEGVNSAHWLHNNPCLLTGCGNGTVALWDTSLGVPCVWYKGPQNGGLHHRSVNGVAVSQDDYMYASCSDEQKVVLYGPSTRREKCRLTNLQENPSCL